MEGKLVNSYFCSTYFVFVFRASGITAVVDDYVDKLLVYVRNYIVKAGLDPNEMPDTTLKVSFTLL